NHDDFGGHAKRNEFVVDGKLLALNGGTLNIESPLRYNLPSRQLLQGIGVDLDRFVKSNESNRSLYSSLGLRGAHFFDKETWGEDRLVVRPPAGGGGRGGGGGASLFEKERGGGGSPGGAAAGGRERPRGRARRRLSAGIPRRDAALDAG